MEDREIEVVRGISKAMGIVMAHVNTAAGRDLLQPGDVYVVWFCKTLQNWKALVSTTLKDNMYYEVTYDGDGQRAYLDAYQKVHNLVVNDYADGFQETPGDRIHPTTAMGHGPFKGEWSFDPQKIDPVTESGC
jgi:hypothetical protein